MNDLYQKTLERYLDFRSKTCLPATITHNRKIIYSLIKFLRNHYPELDSFAKLRRTPHIEGWLQMLKKAQPPYKKSTHCEYIRAVRRFFNDIREWNWPERPPSTGTRLSAVGSDFTFTMICCIFSSRCSIFCSPNDPRVRVHYGVDRILRAIGKKCQPLLLRSHLLTERNRAISS